MRMAHSQKITIISALLFLSFFVMPDSHLLMTNNEDKLMEIDDFNSKLPSDVIDNIPITQSALDPALFSQNNVSQFNVSETITSVANQTILDIGTNNLTLEIPTDWTFNNHLMNISSVYKPYNVIQNGGVDDSSYWASAVNPIKGSASTSFYMVSDTSKGVLQGGPQKRLLSLYPTMPLGSYAIFGQTIFKPDVDLTIQETDFVRSGSIQYPIAESFTTDPLWTQLLDNPFGGVKSPSGKTVLQWNSGFIECYAKAGTSILELGNPSIAWQKNFTIGIVPKQVLLSVTWSVENLNYEMNDNLTVIARVDGNYVDGTIDYNGITYENATTTTIECDDFSEAETVSHSYINRVFDITSLINSTFDIHTLELGIWFQNIDETNDEVRVCFDQVIIRAEEVDQYKIGEFSFDSTVNGYNKLSDLDNWVVYSSIENTNGDIQTSILGDLSQFITSPAPINLTSISKDILNSSAVTVIIGVYLTRATTFTSEWTAQFDNLVLNLNYAQTNLSKLNLYYSTNGTFTLVNNWTLFTSIPSSSTYLNYSFGFENGSPYSGAKMIFQSILSISKQKTNVATVDYYLQNLDNTQLNRIYWNVKYNNSETINFNWSYFNFQFSGYQFTIIDLPALDGKGNDSDDWSYNHTINPLDVIHNVNASIRTNCSNSNSYAQNLTVKYTNIEIGNNILNGTWITVFNSPNYLNQVVLQNENTGSTKAYDSDSSFIIANQTSSLIGNYNITLYNETNDIHQDFPMYNQSVDGNLSRFWEVKD